MFSRVVVCLVVLVVCQTTFAQPTATLDDTARLLAGLPVIGPLTGLTQDQPSQGHAAAMDKAWTTKEFFQLGPIATWMSSHAPEWKKASGTMYYMFSGPVFLDAYEFFPNASNSILAGLEPVGQVPDVSR